MADENAPSGPSTSNETNDPSTTEVDHQPASTFSIDEINEKVKNGDATPREIAYHKGFEEAILMTSAENSTEGGTEDMANNEDVANTANLDAESAPAERPEMFQMIDNAVNNPDSEMNTINAAEQEAPATSEGQPATEPEQIAEQAPEKPLSQMDLTELNGQRYAAVQAGDESRKNEVDAAMNQYNYGNAEAQAPVAEEPQAEAVTAPAEQSAPEPAGPENVAATAVEPVEENPNATAEMSEGKARGDWGEITERELQQVKDKLATKEMDGLSEDQIKTLEERQVTLQETLDYLGGKRDERQESPADKPYDQMRLGELTDRLAKARDEGDKTTSLNIQDAILDKVIAQKHIPEDHKQALLDRISDMADAKRQKNGGETAPVNNGEAATPNTDETVDETDTGNTLINVEKEIDKLQEKLSTAQAEGLSDEDIAEIEFQINIFIQFRETLIIDVRSAEDGQTLTGLDDKAYEDMTIEELNAIRKEALKNGDSTIDANVVNEIASRNKNGKKDGEKTDDDTEDTGEGSLLVDVENRIAKLQEKLDSTTDDGEKAKIQSEIDHYKEIESMLMITLLGKTDEKEPKFTDKAYEDMTIEELNAIRKQAIENGDSTTDTNVVNEIARRGKAGEEPEPEPGEGEDPIPKGGEKPKFNKEKPFELKAGRTNDILKAILDAAKERDEHEQAENKFNIHTQKNIFKALKSRITHSVLFKQNTQTLGAKELMDALREAKGEDEQLSFEEFDSVLSSLGISFPDDQERAFLGMLASNMDGLTNQIDAPAEVQDKIKTLALAYTQAIAASGLTDAQRADLKKSYEGEISKVLGETMGEAKTDVEIYANNAAELLERCAATMKHENGKAEVDKMLAEMKITIGERQYGPNNHMDTSYLEKIDRLGKKYNVASVCGKTAFVVGSWVATGVVAGIAVRGVKMSGTTATGAALGSLAGPIGTLVGVAVGAGASAVWARYMARRRASEAADMASVNVEAQTEGVGLDRKGRRELKPYQDDEGNIRGDLTPEEQAEVNTILTEHKKQTTMEKLKPQQHSMPEIISDLNRYMKPKADLPEDWDKNDPYNYVVRDDLNPAEKQGLATTFAKATALLAYEKQYNEKSSGISDAEAAKGGLSKLLRSANDPSGRALNLFEATTEEAYTSEKYRMLNFLDIAQQVVGDPDFQKTTVEQLDGNNNVKNVTLGEIMKLQATTTSTESDAAVSKWIEGVDGYIKHTGNVSAAVAGSTTLLLGLSSVFIGAAVREAVAAKNGTDVNTVLDIFKQKANIAGNHIQNVAINNNGNGTATVQTPTGPKNVNLDPTTGRMSDVDVSSFKQMGIEITQQTKPNGETIISGDKYLESIGGKVRKVYEYLNNNTHKIDGTERLAGYYKMDNGDIVLWQKDGVAKLGSKAYKILEEGKAGNVFARFSNGGVMLVPDQPMQVVGDHLEQIIKATDPMSKLFDSAGKQLVTYGTNIVSSTGLVSSIATEPVNRIAEIAVQQYATDFAGSQLIPDEVIKAGLDWLTTGLTNTKTKSVYEDQVKKPGTAPTGEPQPPVPPVKPEGGDQPPKPPVVPPVPPIKPEGGDQPPVPPIKPEDNDQEPVPPVPPVPPIVPTGGQQPPVPPIKPEGGDQPTVPPVPPRNNEPGLYDFPEDVNSIETDMGRIKPPIIPPIGGGQTPPVPDPNYPQLPPIGGSSASQPKPPVPPIVVTDSNGRPINPNYPQLPPIGGSSASQPKPQIHTNEDLSDEALGEMSDEYVLENYKYSRLTHPDMNDDQTKRYRRALIKHGIPIPTDEEVFSEPIDNTAGIVDLTRQRQAAFSEGKGDIPNLEAKIKSIDQRLNELGEYDPINGNAVPKRQPASVPSRPETVPVVEQPLVSPEGKVNLDKLGLLSDDEFKSLDDSIIRKAYKEMSEKYLTPAGTMPKEKDSDEETYKRLRLWERLQNDIHRRVNERRK